MRPCQNAMTGNRPEAKIPSKCSRPLTRHRHVRPSTLIAGISERRDRRRLEALAARRPPAGLGAGHSPSYCGPPPPSGGTHVITW